MLIDVGVRIISTNVELKIGVLAALVGAPIFIWIASKSGRHGYFFCKKKSATSLMESHCCKRLRSTSILENLL